MLLLFILFVSGIALFVASGKRIRRDHEEIREKILLYRATIALNSLAGENSQERMFFLTREHGISVGLCSMMAQLARNYMQFFAPGVGKVRDGSVVEDASFSFVRADGVTVRFDFPNVDNDHSVDTEEKFGEKDFSQMEKLAHGVNDKAYSISDVFYTPAFRKAGSFTATMFPNEEESRVPGGDGVSLVDIAIPANKADAALRNGEIVAIIAAAVACAIENTSEGKDFAPSRVPCDEQSLNKIKEQANAENK